MNNEIPLSKAELEIAATCSAKPALDYSATSYFCEIDADELIKDIDFMISRFRLAGLVPSCLYLSVNYYKEISKYAHKSFRIIIDPCVVQENQLFGMRVYIVNEPNHIGIGL